MKKWEKNLIKALSNSSVDNKEVVVKKFINKLVKEMIEFTENELPPSIGSQKTLLIEKLKEEYFID